MVTIYRCGTGLIRWTANDPDGGPPHLVLGASPDCCCCEPGVCIVPSLWRIVDGDERVYAAGGSSDGLLNQLPQPFTPIYYWNSGLIGLRLQVFGCSGGGGWDTIEEFSVTVTLCDATNARYPEHAWTLPGVNPCWAPPADCACQDQQNDPCDPCPPLCAGAAGTGQEWRNPMPGEAKRFAGTVDGEWTNLNNWEDADGLTPAMSLPTFSSEVTIAAGVTSKPNDFAISVGKLTITADGAMHVPASTAYLECAGLVGRGSICPDTYGDISVSVSAEFTGSGSIEGRVSGNAIFYDDSMVASNGVLNGYGSFFESSHNDGTVQSGAYFTDGAYNSGTVEGDAVFTGGANNTATGVVEGNGEFDGPFAMNNGEVQGDATFNTMTLITELVGNSSSGTVLGSATFSGTSVNSGSVSGDGTFSSQSQNRSSVGGDGFFSDDALNMGTVAGDGTFSGTSYNQGSVAGNAAFSGSSVNEGSVGGTATFTGSACNNGGTAASFDPDPPPECI